MSLESNEIQYVEKKIGRALTPTEFQIVAAEWSEHCSYKSSKKHLKTLPMDGPRVIFEKGYDSGVLDVGDGYVVTVHIESHNHPSAVEPYGGAATGVGGVIRDILSAGTRPIALFDCLRFGDIQNDSHARWLFKNAVKGVADYGNCLGIPTIGGEVEFDKCYTDYALVDVASIGFGKKDDLIKNHAELNDLVVLIGGSTGRDGIGGSQFASDSLESEDRSAVQIPDPFIEKLIIEAILESRKAGVIKAMKDLGGGGLSCAVSETAESMGVGITMNVDDVHKRESDMSAIETMVSESQERMLVVTDKEKLEKLRSICDKFNLKCSVIGTVTSDKMMHVKQGDETLALMSADVIANAPLLDRSSSYPKYLDTIKTKTHSTILGDLSDVFLQLITHPNIASKIWVYGQYDHEVGIRTVIRPGSDAAVLRLDNGKFLSAKIDGNPKQCYIDPKHGAMGCFEEACRNVVCTGATPIGMVDHLQFGNPEDPEIFWTFLESLKGITEFANFFNIPCVGGKVSLYNETPKGPIKPSPLIGVLGLIDDSPLSPKKLVEGDALFIVGETSDELGGSEYYETIHDVIGGKCPQVHLETSKKNMNAILDVVKHNLAKNIHDCSKGGLCIAVSELCFSNDIGCDVNIETIPRNTSLENDEILFSESHSRYLISCTPENTDKLTKLLAEHEIRFKSIGKFTGDLIKFSQKNQPIIDVSLDKAYKSWSNSLGDLIEHG